MKIKALKEIWTASPEKKWSAGEVLDLPDYLANQLLSNNPNFRRVEEEVKTTSPKKKKKWQ